MTLLGHLRELRNKLVLVLIITVFLNSLAILVFYPSFLRGLATVYAVPDIDALAANLSSCTARVKLWLDIGLIVFIPVLGFEIWRFAVPGLKRSGQKHAILVVIAIALLPILAILLAGLYGRLISPFVNDIPLLLDIANKLALLTLLIVFAFVLKYVVALLRLGTIWQSLPLGLVTTGVAMIISWPVWGFALLAILSMLLLILGLSRLMLPSSQKAH